MAIITNPPIIPQGPLVSQGIQNFYNQIAVTDFARQNLFRITQLGPITSVQNYEGLYVTSTTIPSKAITNVPVPFMGLQFNVPGTVTYPGSDSWNVTFRLPANADIRSEFEAWMLGIFNDQTSTGAYNVPGPGSVVGLTLMDKSGAPVRIYNLYGVWVKQINEATLNLTTAGEIIEQQVTLAYQYWY
jgi:hypothetical protein